jgi:hypothetical protein
MLIDKKRFLPQEAKIKILKFLFSWNTVLVIILILNSLISFILVIGGTLYNLIENKTNEGKTGIEEDELIKIVDDII